MVNRHLTIAFAAAALFAASPAAASSGSISVALDNATPVTLPGEAASVVIGNPAIADIYVQDGRNVFVLGRSYGTTNLVAVDRAGKQIANLPVTVTSGRAMAVTVHRGPSGQISYACNGRCERSLDPTDNPNHFKGLLESVKGKTDQGEQVAEAAKAAAN